MPNTEFEEVKAFEIIFLNKVLFCSDKQENKTLKAAHKTEEFKLKPLFSC